MIQFNITIEEIQPGLIAIDRRCVEVGNLTNLEVGNANVMNAMLTKVFSHIAKELGARQGNWAKEVIMPLDMQGQINQIVNAARVRRLQPPQA